MKKITLALVALAFGLSCEKPEVTPVPGDVIVYPNPALSQFFIRIINPGTKPYELQVYDVEGELIRDEQINQGQTTIPVDTENSPAGKFNVVVKRPQEGISKIQVLKL